MRRIEVWVVKRKTALGQEIPACVVRGLMDPRLSERVGATGRHVRVAVVTTTKIGGMRFRQERECQFPAEDVYFKRRDAEGALAMEKLAG